MKHWVRIDELKAAGQLPTPTGVAMAVLEMTQKEDVRVEEIARVLQSDPALAGQMLKCANSARYGAGRPVVAVSEAVARLGLRMVRQLALGFSLLSNSRTGPCQGFDYGGYWSRALGAGIASQTICVRGRIMAPEEAFTCGLLCQVGRLALATVHPEPYAEVLAESAGGSDQDLAGLEREHFALDHNDLTAALLADWGLPEVCVEAARCHEQPEASDLEAQGRILRLARVLHLATYLAEVWTASEQRRPALLPELYQRAARINLDPDTLAELSVEAVEQWHEWGQILDVHTCQVPPLSDLAAGDSSTSAEADAAQDAPGAGHPSHGLRVLVIDPDPTELDWIAQTLRSAGHQVSPAGNCHQGLRKALEDCPQLVIVDWEHVEADSAGFKALRETKLGRQIYVLAIANDAGAERLQAGPDGGADEWVTRPLTDDQLVARVQASRRVIELQEELLRDREQLQRYVGGLAVANRKLEHAAVTDPLTGLYNRRYAMERLNQAWAGARRANRPLACMILDVDHFKQVNDTYGHDAGDVVLQALADVLRSTLRTNDVVCRFGGEEFLVVCEDTDAAGARYCAERIRAAVEARPVRAYGHEVPVTVSIGVAAWHSRMAGPPSLIKAADEALYAAKTGGRNRVCVATSTEEATAQPCPGTQMAAPTILMQRTAAQ